MSEEKKSRVSGSIPVEVRRADTSPVEILSRAMTVDEVDIARAVGVSEDAHATVSQLIKVVSHTHALEARRAIEADERTAAQNFAADFQRMRARVNILWALLAVALLAAGGSTLAVITWLKDGAKDDLIKQQLSAHDAEHELRLRTLENSVLIDTQRLNDLDRARWQLDRAPAHGSGSTP